MFNLKDTTSWGNHQLHTFTNGEKKVYVVVEFSAHYGFLIQAWQIGDQEHDTGVESFYKPGKMLTCHVSNELCGVCQ